jgi:hypothetical protein
MGGHVKGVTEDMMAFPEIPGIIEGAMTITPEPDGRISFRVLVSANDERGAYCNHIELIVNPEYVRQALAVPKVRQLDGTRLVDDSPTFPCHIGFKAQ